MLCRTCASDARDAGSLAHYRLAGSLRIDGQDFPTPQPKVYTLMKKLLAASILPEILHPESKTHDPAPQSNLTSFNGKMGAAQEPAREIIAFRVEHFVV